MVLKIVSPERDRMPGLRNVCKLVLPVLLLGACALNPSPENAYKSLRGETLDLGAEIRRNPGRIGKLFSIPEAGFERDADWKAVRGWLGIFIKNPDREILGPEGEPAIGVEVGWVFPHSPASRGGLMQGDLIVGAGDKGFQDPIWEDRAVAFREQVLEKEPGTAVAFTVLRAGEVLSVVVTLEAKPAGEVRLTPITQPDDPRDRSGDSVLRYALEKEELVGEFVRTEGAIRKKTAEAISPVIQHGGFNPFRLTRVNDALYYPFELPVIADEITSRLYGSFGRLRKDLPKLIQVGQEELGLIAAASLQVPAPEPALTLAQFIEQFVETVERARILRDEALSALSDKERDSLYEMAEKMLIDDPGENEKSPEQSKEEQVELERFLNTVLHVDISLIIQGAKELAGLLNVNTLPGLRDNAELPDFSHPGWKMTREAGLTTLETPVGIILIGGTERNVYRKDVLLIVDLGGDDVYMNSAGGTSRSLPFSVVVDLSGNDQYKAAKSFAQGAGLVGAGFLIDIAGNDMYSALNQSQGSGFIGVGMLVDVAGDDVYKSIAASQGAGAWGLGILAEGGGDDDYSAGRYAQGFGFVLGLGAVIEFGGNDKYFAGGVFPDQRDPENAFQSLSQGFGFGIRPWEAVVGASGGIGVLADAEGDDVYTADYFAQGASYWYALGILADRKGDDRYTAGRYAQGAGIHVSAGILVDSEGDDRYTARFGVSQGLGHDLAPGFLLDNGGNDTYICGVLCQGAGNDNGIGVLSDNGGDDRYEMIGQGQGWGTNSPVRGIGSFGFHFDTGGGHDEYSSGAVDEQLLYRGNWGLLLDMR